MIDLQLPSALTFFASDGRDEPADIPQVGDGRSGRRGGDRGHAGGDPAGALAEPHLFQELVAHPAGRGFGAFSGVFSGCAGLAEARDVPAGDHKGHAQALRQPRRGLGPFPGAGIHGMIKVCGK